MFQGHVLTAEAQFFGECFFVAIQPMDAQHSGGQCFGTKRFVAKRVGTLLFRENIRHMRPIEGGIVAHKTRFRVGLSMLLDPIG